MLAGAWQGGQEFENEGSTKDTFFQLKSLCDQLSSIKNFVWEKVYQLVEFNYGKENF